MSEEQDEILEEKKEDVSILEVKVINQPEVKKIPSDFDSVDDSQYENMYPTDEMIKEYEEEDGET